VLLFHQSCTTPASTVADLSGSERPGLAGDASIEPAAENGELLEQVRVEVFADDRRSGPNQEVGNAGALAAIFGAAQDHCVFAGYLIFVNVSTARHEISL
jgi:hypothetical protein